MTQSIWNWKATYQHEKPDEMFDCLVAEFLLSAGRSVPDEASAEEKYHAASLAELADQQQANFAEIPSLAKYFMEIEMPLIPVLWEMEQAGIYLDTAKLTKVGEEIDVAVAKLNESMKAEVGFEINLNSAVQIGDFMAGKLGVPLARTKTGRYATNETEISQYAEQFPFIQQLLEYRELTKLRSTYVDSLISKVDEHGRIHTTYTQVAASTGRLSSNNPNLQNIPGSQGFGQKIKSCFMAGEGNVLISFDYSQQELRILAHLCQEESLMKAFQEHKDIHTATAAEVFQIPFDQVTHEQRRTAKTINFGVIYGMGSYGMSQQLHIPVEAAQQFIDKFYETYPKIRAFFDEYLKQARLKGFAETLLGRRRYVFEFPKQTTIDNAMRRVLTNYPIQGSAADLMKKAMVTVHEEVVAKNPDVQLLLQIHDDLVFEVKNDSKLIAKFADQVREIMCHVYPLAVPIEVDMKIGTNWGEMEKGE